MQKDRFFYKWNLSDKYPAKGIKYHGKSVYSTFACGGGSTMGYKLAGFDVIGANDIDSQMAKVYNENHKPRYYDLCPIRDLLEKELPKEYYELDILDGSPPCSNFSMAGSREKAWKKEKKFREGQSKQKLSDLFFDWIALVDKLRPKTAIAENVKGMLAENAKAYTKEVIKELTSIGYIVQLFVLNAASMGVPQKRERVFFICRRKDLLLKPIDLKFNIEPIKFIAFKEDTMHGSAKLSSAELELWGQRIKSDLDFGSITKRLYNKRSRFTTKLVQDHHVPNTIIASDNTILYEKARKYTDYELCCIGSWPLDYEFLDVKPRYLIGMSVPPIMMAQIAYQIYIQWLSKL